MATSHTARVPEGKTVTLECPYCHMLMRVPYHSAGVRATCESCQGITNFHFVGRSSPVTPKPAGASFAVNVLIVLGLVLIIGGMVLSAGNRTGAFPTFPFAGFITGGIGMALIAAAMHTGD